MLVTKNTSDLDTSQLACSKCAILCRRSRGHDLRQIELRAVELEEFEHFVRVLQSVQILDKRQEI